MQVKKFVSPILAFFVNVSITYYGLVTTFTVILEENLIAGLLQEVNYFVHHFIQMSLCQLQRIINEF